jgi:hypothetical protein
MRVVAKYVPRHDVPGGGESPRGCRTSDTHTRPSLRSAGGSDAQGPALGGVDGAGERSTERWPRVKS